MVFNQMMSALFKQMVVIMPISDIFIISSGLNQVLLIGATFSLISGQSSPIPNATFAMTIWSFVGGLEEDTIFHFSYCTFYVQVL